jgi:hypothetical protein
MCVRCGTGRIAWCTDPDRHGDLTAEHTGTTKPSHWPDAPEPEHMSNRDLASVVSMVLNQTPLPDDFRRAGLREVIARLSEEEAQA